MTDPKPGSRDVLIDHDAVRSWAEENGAVPVRSETESGVPLGFRFEGAEERLDWSRFFTSFENGRLALLVDGSDFAFVDRDRVADTDDDRPDAERERRSERRRAEEHHRDEVVDPKSDHRADEAAEQENVDNHRDEEPFES